MQKKATNLNNLNYFTNSAFELVKWPLVIAKPLEDKVVAFQTSRLSPLAHTSSTLSMNTTSITSSTFGGFNLGDHVGDSPVNVTKNREILSHCLNNPLSLEASSHQDEESRSIQIQWLEQVHNNDVAIIDSVIDQPIIADASITRTPGVALAIMTADCLPILLADVNGEEIAAIHGGWRSLAKNIVNNTLLKMHTKNQNIVAWLGPCIGPNAFEVGGEVRQTFITINADFEQAFTAQQNGKYLADLHLIARIQLNLLGVTKVSSLSECTVLQHKKYYSYRKSNKTGRMASIICRR